MAKARKTAGSVKVAKAIIAELNDGTREAANLAEGLSVDFAVLMANALPDIPADELQRLVVGKPSITERMRIAGELCLEHVGLTNLDTLTRHTSDTVRGWAAYVI